MSFLTGTNWEEIYLNDASGTAKNTFTAETAINDVAGMGPQAYLPAGFFLAPGGSRKGLFVRARGLLSTTSSAPTFTWTLRFGTSAGATAGVIGLGSAAITAGVSQTNQPWEFEGDITIGDNAGNAGTTLRGYGQVTCPGLASPFMYGLWGGPTGGAASPGSTATFDPTQPYWLTLNATCGTSSASNSIQCLHFEVVGKN